MWIGIQQGSEYCFESPEKRCRRQKPEVTLYKNVLNEAVAYVLTSEGHQFGYVVG